MRKVILVYTTLLAFVIACGRDETVRQVESTPSQASTAAGGPENSPPQSTTSVTGPERDEPSSRVTSAGATQEVHLIEYRINMPAELSAGRVAFNVENGGKEDHGFVIEGNGVRKETATLKRGDTGSVEAELTPGTYTVWCPVKDHAQKGMKTTVTVR